MRSGTASTTKSTSPNPSYSVVPVMRPTISSACLSASSWVIFSFLTSEPSWPVVTCCAFSSPWSTNFCSTSFSTTSTPDEAITWAISPPIVPAPTTAALNTYIRSVPPVVAARGRLQSRFLFRLGGEAAEGPVDRGGKGPADEQDVGDLPQDARLGEPIVELERDPGHLEVVRRLEGHGLGGAHRLLEDLGHD